MRVVSVKICVFRCSEKISAWDSIGDSVLPVESSTTGMGTTRFNNFNAEFCVVVCTAFNTIRRSPPTGAAGTAALGDE